MRIWVALWFSLLPLFTTAQATDHDFADRYTTVFERCRMKIFEEHADEIRALDSLVDIYLDTLPASFTRQQLLYSFHDLLYYDNYIPWPFDAGVYAENMRKKRKLTAIPPEHARIISDCKQLIEMIEKQLVEVEFPFKVLPPLEYAVRFIEFVQPLNGEVVAEIGAGDGYHGLLLAAVYPEVLVVLNELRKDHVNDINQKIALFPMLYGRDRVAGVLGDKRSTMMRDHSVDRLLVANTYHHFSREEDMLASIRKTLKTTGTLYIAEPVYANRPEGAEAVCQKAKPRADVIAEITNAGFQLVEEQTLEEWYFLRFEVK